MLVHEFLEKSALTLPAKTALICGGQRWTYADMDADANRLAHALMEGGVQRGDRVGVYGANTHESVVAIFGILKAGAVFVPINPTTKADKLLYILNNCRASALVFESRPDNAPLADMIFSRCPSLKRIVLTGTEAGRLSLCNAITYDDVQSRFPPQKPANQNIDVDLACLIYTSGTTGDPKGVMSDHSNVDFASSSIISYLGNTPDDVVINVLPLSFDYGLYQLLMTFKSGGTLVLERSFAYPAAILKQIELERVTGLPGVPTMFAMLVNMDLAAFNLTSLRYLTNTAAALPASHILALRRKFPWAALFSMYGLTETKRTLYLPPSELEERPNSVGIPIPGTEAWVEDDEGRRLGPGLVGELVVRGRHVMRGYWEAPEASSARFRPGPIPGERLCYSGDLFRRDEDGFFYFVGRKDDIIKSRGEKVAPKEVECALYALPGVKEAAVIGVPDPVLGQAIKAFVVSEDPNLTMGRIIAHCRACLEDFMVPKQVEFRAELPKTASGKIKKTDLK